MKGSKKDRSRAKVPRSSVQLTSSHLRPEDTGAEGAPRPGRKACVDEESGRTTSLSEAETSSAARDQDATHRGVEEPLPDETGIHGAMLQFAVDVYQELSAAVVAQGGTANVVFSPLALQTTLALMLALAEGRTAEQIASVLHLHCCSNEDFQAYMRRRTSKLTGLAGNLGYFCLNNKTRLITGGCIAAPDSADGVRLSEALESLRVEHHGADFVQDGEAVRQRTNEWLHVMTAFECERAISEGAVDARTSLMVASVTSLRAADWKWKFRLRDSVTGVFYNTSGETKQVTMMCQRGRFPTGDFAEDLNATALELRYRRYKKSMVFILPRERDGLAALEKALTGPKLRSCLERLEDRGCVEVTLPKFGVKQALDLRNVLPRMGVVDVFVRGRANLPGLVTHVEALDALTSSSSVGCPHLSLAIHCAFAQTRERGHKLGTWAEPARSKFTVDHPFMFVVLSRAPEAVLLIGSVRDVRLPYI
ncbi:ipis-1-like isoform X1 [Amblyomma americanum]